MAQELYRVVFTGEVLEGHDAGDVKRALAALYRADVSKMEALFTGKPVIVKKDVDYETAEKWRRAYERAGAKCLVEPLPPTGTKAAPEQARKAAPAGAAAQGPVNGGEAVIAFAGCPTIISPAVGHGSVAFSPMKCSTLTGFDGGVNLNRHDIGELFFESLRLFSVFGTREQGLSRHMVMVFLKGKRRPFIIPANGIRYADFPGVRAGSVLASLRNFVAFLCNNSPGLMLDSATFEFAGGREPAFYEGKDETALSTALGKELMQGETVDEAPEVKEPLHEAEPAPEPEMGVVLTEEDYSAFVGKNSDKYLPKFRKFMLEGGGFSLSWHWPAFFLPFWWLLYRRLYLWAAVALFARFIPVISWVAFGLAGNYLYFRHAKNKIHALKSGGKPSVRVLARAGGVNRAVAYVGVTLAVIVILGGWGSYFAVSSRNEGKIRLLDETARAELKKACTMAMKHSIRNPDDLITMKRLAEIGYVPPPEVEMEVLDGRWDSLGIRARHADGARNFMADKSCYITQEADDSP